MNKHIPAALSPSTSHRFRALFLFVTALFLFACLDTTTKFLATRYNVPLVVAVRYIVHALLMIVILAPQQGLQLIQTHRTGLVIIRAASLAIASLLLGMALIRMPLAETTSIIFLSPILVVLLARPFLGERIGLIGWIAAVIGFCGVLLIVHPGNSLDAIGIVYALCAVAGLVVYQLLSRVLVSTERTITMLFYTALIGSIGYGIFLPWFWKGQAPTLMVVLLFLSMGVTGGLGHLLYTSAYRYASASLLAPMNYLQLLWAGLLGWVVFDHVPDNLSIFGMSVVAASGLLIALKSRQH